MEVEEQESCIYFVNLRYEEFDIVKVNYDGPFLRRKPVNFSSPNELVSHLVEHQRVEKKRLRNIDTCESENIEYDSEQRKMCETVCRLEKSTKYRLADIREAIRKKKVKNRSKKKYEDHITYYNSTTKRIEGDTNQQWQFQGLDHSSPTKAEPNKVRVIFRWLKENHSAFLPNLTEIDTEQTEEDLLCLMRLHMKDESLLDIDFNNKNDYFKSIDNSLEKLKLNPYLILQYQLYSKNAPKYRVKTYPGTDNDLILDYYINRLIILDKLFHRKYPEIYISIESLDNDLATLSEVEAGPDSPQGEELKDSVENSESDLGHPNAVENFACKRSIQPNILDKDSTQNNDSKALHCQEQPENVKTALDNISGEPNAVRNYKSGESRSLGKSELLTKNLTQKKKKIERKKREKKKNKRKRKNGKETSEENKLVIKKIFNKKSMRNSDLKTCHREQSKSTEASTDSDKLPKLDRIRQKQEKSEESASEEKKPNKLVIKKNFNEKNNEITWHCEEKKV